MKIGVLTYTFKHKKTYDILCLLKARGYKDVLAVAQKPKYKKSFLPKISHRPENVFDIPEIEELVKNLDYQYMPWEEDYKYDDDIIFLVGGSGILPDSFIHNYQVINAHPGYIPLARGLDALKWSIIDDIPLGVTTHLVGEYVDGGEIIERKIIDVKEYDTFHAVSQRVYDNEINMLVNAIGKLNEEHLFIKPQTVLHRRMPHDIEEQLLVKFDEYKLKYGEIIKKGELDEI